MTSLFRILTLSLFLLTAPSFASDPLRLPDIGDTSQEVISPEQMKALGRAFMNRLRDTTPLIEDPALNHYMEQLGDKLVAYSDQPSLDFTFFIVDANTINAFAAPGGYIGTHTGLFLAARNESELAAVMAHEIAHVTQRHLARAYDNASRMSLPTAAAILAAILIGTQDSEAGQAALMSVQAGSIQQQIDFTRANEEEADRIGMQTLAGAGFDPRGMPGFFQRLQEQTRYYGARNFPGFLSTHPVTGDRIAEAYSRIDQLNYNLQPDNLNFYLMQARMRVLIEKNPASLLNLFGEQDTSLQLPTEARQYGLALARMANNQPEEASTLLEKLYKSDPDRIAFRLALAESYLKSRKTQAGIELLKHTLNLYPDSQVVIYHYAAALVDSGQHKAAIQLLEDDVRQFSNTTIPFYPLLAKAAGGAGNKALARQAMAEQFYLTGKTHAAIEQLELAIPEAKDDFYRASQIEVRLGQFKTEALKEKK